jgi:DNA repair exonuclease SbcCD ATPase subunit
MRITSIILRNCRLHRELKVDFDPSRTLIGGPNETGKSTLIEAVHRALFLKAKGNTEHHRAMISSLHPGHPEVELAFEAGGNMYLLKKRFGPAGTTTLAPSNSVALSSEAAEIELARLLSVEVGIAGKAITIQWAHLWVWQGQAGDDPSAHATAQHDGLLLRLQQMGGAAALQSELDARVAKHFEETKNQIYIHTGKAKKGSSLERAESASSLAQEELTLANERVRRLDSVAVDLENASRTLLASSTILTSLGKQNEEAEARARQLGELRQQEAEQFHAAKESVARHGGLEAANEQILAARVEISQLEESLKPQQEAIAGLESASQEARGKATMAESAYRSATEAVRAARIRHDLASAHVLLFEKTEAHTKLDDKDKKVSKRRRDLAGLEEQLAKLPKVDKAKLTKILKLESECSNARVALQAMATGFEVIAADKPVKAGGQAIDVGQRQILTEDTEVQIGPTVRLRIQPGGGISLAEARQAEAEALMVLQAALDSFGLKSVTAATEVNAEREELNSRIKTLRAELEGMGAENLTEELQGAQNDLTAAKANVERLAIMAPEIQAPEEKVGAKALAKALEKKLSEAEEQDAEAKATYDHSAKALVAAEKILTGKRSETDQQRFKLTGLHAQLQLLQKTHGDETARNHALHDSQSATSKANKLLKATSDAIAALQPEMLEGDRNRIARAITEKTSEQSEAGKQIAVAKAALRSDGSEDPAADLAFAEAKARSASEHRTSLQRQAQAVALLDELFQEEQRRLAERFTQPLADKISGYLQCIFGAGARAQLELENNEFSGLRLFRPGFGNAPFDFQTLSGGAKEQTAAAVRLAMAEVLATDQGGCLPVIFDDAFAYSDPERVNQLQRMLDLAATRGLQIIVLTCNPADYAALGAKTVTLRPDRNVTGPRNNTVPESGSESSAGNAPRLEGQPPEPAVRAVTDELCQEFLDTLLGSGGSKGNQALRDDLGWDEGIYGAVKEALVAAGRVVPGKGRGGSVSMSNS